MKKLKNIQSIEEYLDEASSMPNTENYMFFENLKTIKQCIEELMMLDPMMVDQTLKNGHDWAEDHVATAKESIDQVTHFFMNKK